jgi:dolichol-phosphate mannosyltransferase
MPNSRGTIDMETDSTVFMSKEDGGLVSIILPTYNELGNIESIIGSLLKLKDRFELEILVVDDDSPDGTGDLVKSLSRKIPEVRLIRRMGRAGLASAIKEGLLDAAGDLALVMDSDGQHDPAAVTLTLNTLIEGGFDLIVGSRFHANAEIKGLSNRREHGSSLANAAARYSLNKSYSRLTDTMSGFFALRLDRAMPFVRAVDVNGFKFLYEFLAISKGNLNVSEVPLTFQPRTHGTSKLDVAIFWDFLISVLHNLSFRLLPRRAISFGLVGTSGVFVQLVVNQVLMVIGGINFEQALPIAVIAAASSNYMINNALTFRFQRLKGTALFKGLLKFLVVASLPVLANVGVASAFHRFVSTDLITAQLAGILVVFIWNYAASSRFVWNTP